ncbi:MAG TPA: 23S rRNA (uracil(1939)-C(5))-methyltransferase RlmD [Kofleriaceae bacterium]|nr:23S rRNA (uracil(1939)-C(5))-methyltransferase RlmD [Kofleriaceae bacterium]
MRPGDRIELLATDLDLEGLGVGRAGDIDVHAVDLLPGERAEVAIDHVSRHAPRAWAAAGRRLGPPAPERVTPPCPAFPRCGGCAWQHLDGAAQLEHKRRRVERALGTLSPAPAVAPVVPSPNQLGYRNKASYVVSGAGGHPALGAYAARSHAWVDTAGCRVVMPVVDRTAAAVRAALSGGELAVYDESLRAGHLRYAVVRASRAGQVLVGLVATSAAPRPALERAAAAVMAEPGVAGVVWVANDATSGTIIPPDAAIRVLAGAPSIGETLAGVAVDVGIDSFLQIHLDQAEALYARLADLVGAGPTTRAIDLYCGLGAIAFTLAVRGARALGLERNPSAARAAGRAAERAGLAERARFTAAPAAELPRLLGREPVDLIVVNPPRQGLDPVVRRELAAHPPPLLAYVSCGPESLARDLAELARGGLEVDAVEPFDLMPGTGHVETLVIARRSGRARDRS